MNQRNSWIVFVVLGMALGLATAGTAAPSIKVFANGQEVISEVPATLIAGTTYLPLRATAEALGARLQWVPKTKTAVLCRGELCFPVRVTDPASEARIIAGRVVLPLRKMAEALECEIKWDAELRRVEVTTKSE
jgi:hypothetical protein